VLRGFLFLASIPLDVDMQHRLAAVYDPVPVGCGYPPIGSIEHLYHFSRNCFSLHPGSRSFELLVTYRTGNTVNLIFIEKELRICQFVWGGFTVYFNTFDDYIYGLFPFVTNLKPCLICMITNYQQIPDYLSYFSMSRWYYLNLSLAMVPMVSEPEYAKWQNSIQSISSNWCYAELQ